MFGRCFLEDLLVHSGAEPKEVFQFFHVGGCLGRGEWNLLLKFKIPNAIWIVNIDLKGNYLTQATKVEAERSCWLLASSFNFFRGE